MTSESAPASESRAVAAPSTSLQQRMQQLQQQQQQLLPHSLLSSSASSHLLHKRKVSEYEPPMSTHDASSSSSSPMTTTTTGATSIRVVVPVLPPQIPSSASPLTSTMTPNHYFTESMSASRPIGTTLLSTTTNVPLARHPIATTTQQQKNTTATTKKTLTPYVVHQTITILPPSLVQWRQRLTTNTTTRVTGADDWGHNETQLLATLASLKASSLPSAADQNGDDDGRDGIPSSPAWIQARSVLDHDAETMQAELRQLMQTFRNQLLHEHATVQQLEQEMNALRHEWHHQWQEQVRQQQHTVDALTRDLERTRHDAEALWATIPRSHAPAGGRTHRSPHHQTVTRLRHQISLYANCTGIKWDYSPQLDDDDSTIGTNDNDAGGGGIHETNAVPLSSSLDSRRKPSFSTLAGNVAIPERAIIHEFSFDTQDLSRFEIANRLWNMMDGKGLDHNGGNAITT